MTATGSEASGRPPACLSCGGSVRLTPSRRKVIEAGGDVYCSTKCKPSAQVTKLCVVCDEPVTRYAVDFTADAVYCSRRCQGVGSSTRREYLCAGCGIPVLRYPSQAKGPVYCSRECHWQHARPTKPRTGETRACANCGVDVYVPKWRLAKESAFTCSVACNAAVQRKRVEWSCERCGKPMLTRPSGVKRACSEACWRRLRFLETSFRLDADGYVIAFVGRDGSVVMEHQLVMERLLGRPLAEGENVHHKHGQRADNRLSQLELWSVSQPPGQRVVDKLGWARELLAMYADVEAVLV